MFKIILNIVFRLHVNIWFKPIYTSSEAEEAFKKSGINQWNSILSPQSLPETETSHQSNIEGRHSFNVHGKESKPTFANFEGSTTPRIPQLSATENFGLKLEETTPYTTGKLKSKDNAMETVCLNRI